MLKINHLDTDFEDGVLLGALLEQISGKNVGIVNKKPRIRAQKLENTGACLRFLRDEGIKLVAIGPEGSVLNLFLLVFKRLHFIS
jgi:Calponin homology (CH) domain